jgi:hypothetical protein
MSKTYISTPEHAKQIRSEIKAAIKAGRIPVGTKTSVRSDSYSGGSAIRVEIVAVPAGFEVLSRAQVAFYARMGNRGGFYDMNHEERERHTPAAKALFATINEIVSAHHDDRSYREPGGDMISNQNFHKSIQFGTDLEIAERERIERELAAEASPQTDSPKAATVA